MGSLKESKQALGAEVISRFNDFAPPTLLAQASRINFSTRLFNLIVTNVPGPQIPLYVLGRELQDVFPVAFLPENHALAIAIMSYNGGIDFGLLGDYDTMEDLEMLATGLSESLADLSQRRRGSRGPVSGRPGRRRRPPRLRKRSRTRGRMRTRSPSPSRRPQRRVSGAVGEFPSPVGR